jgi:DNA processing protein
MLEELPFGQPDFESRAISPLKELGAYEALWDQKGTSFKKIAEMHRVRPGSVPSDFVPETRAYEFADRVCDLLAKARVDEFGVRVHGAGEYPERLRDAAYPVELLYFQGWWDLIATRSVAVVGTRKPSNEGVARTRRLVKELVADKFTIISGLAAGIDTVAHTTAIEFGGWTIGVIGTPISEAYPKENAELQARIANEYLLISQIPVWRYSQQGPRGNRLFFPERNVTMSALTEATIIVEAGETSGTLIQANAALEQGRKLFILDSCFRNSSLTWPEKLAKKGAIRVTEYDDIRRHLDSAIH